MCPNLIYDGPVYALADQHTSMLCYFDAFADCVSTLVTIHLLAARVARLAAPPMPPLPSRGFILGRGNYFSTLVTTPNPTQNGAFPGTAARLLFVCTYFSSLIAARLLVLFSVATTITTCGFGIYGLELTSESPYYVYQNGIIFPHHSALPIRCGTRPVERNVFSDTSFMYISGQKPR
eukprot:CAMPEP_0198220974 /NCGR_PEP_ID=MMETSP1445-20131203/81648_1 /TAXON_ID=36898 /ORGANISM="Pyramimonas sp., Strain CCMP2087" /LENGTH=177 /DNA_ID=CAMNT_0043898933 /DNA_START=97 /DNA_END=630 /DNA_ORIENTATION=+